MISVDEPTKTQPRRGRHARSPRWRISRRRLALLGASAAVVVLAAVAVLAPRSQPEETGPEAGPAPGPPATGTAGDPAGAPERMGPGRGVPPDAAEARPDFPGPATTGVPEGVTLTRSSQITVREDGAVIENLEIVEDGSGAAGLIEVMANNVTIRNVRVTNDRDLVYWGIVQRAGYHGLVVEDSEIFGSPDGGQLQTGIANHGGMITVRRVEIHTITDGIVTSHGLIEDSFLHSPRYFEGDHTDMIQANGGSEQGLPLEIRGNTIINTQQQTSAVFLQDFTGAEHIPVRDVTIEGNWLAGGGYTVYGGGDAEAGTAQVVIRDNVFSREIFPDGGYWGPVAHFDPDAPGNHFSGNIWDDGTTLD